MKKYIVLAAILALFAWIVVPQGVAGQVYSRATTTVATATGTITWTNTQQYAALELKRIWVSGNAVATDTVTVQRVSSDNVWTQSVGTVAVAANVGNTASFTAAYMKNGDKLTFASTAATGSVVMVEYLVQQH